MKCLPICFLVAITYSIFISSPSHAQGISSSQIDSLVEHSLELIPDQAGIAVAVVKEGEILHAKGYGVSSIVDGSQVNEHTLFAIASLSKAFTVTALAILADEGKFSWNDKVVDHIPEFKMYDPYVTANFTIEDLLTHRSGLGLGAGDLLHFPDGNDFTIEDILNSFQYMEPVSAFRTRYDYDNLLYVVAGEIILRITGIPYPDFIESEILQPLGMHNSSATYSRIMDKLNTSSAHTIKDGALVQISNYSNDVTAAAGGIYSSAFDMAHWMLMNLNGGLYGENLSDTLISKERLDEMWKPYSIEDFQSQSRSSYRRHLVSYGLGWEIVDYKGYFAFQHGGGLPGMLSRIVLIPELNLGVLVLTNSSPGGNSYFTVAQTILDSYLEIDETDWIQRGKEIFLASQASSDSVSRQVWRTVLQEKISPISSEDLCATYRDPWFGDMEIFENNHELWIRSLRSPKLTGQLFYYQANTYAIKWDYTDMPCDALAMFELNEDGLPTGFKMKGISPNIDFSFDFPDLRFRRAGY